MNSLLYLSLCLSALYVSVFSLSCMRCEEVTCKPVTCKKGVGLVKDACGCCDKCAKTEQQTCGGPWNIGGKCDKGLSCVVRKAGKVVRFQDVAEDIHLFPGKCEQHICTRKTCLIHQKCTVINNQAVCECPRQCKNVDKPVCGLSNGVEYENECQLRKYECKLGKKIAFKNGPCKRCFMRRKPYKFGEKIRKGLCQSCSCYHGSWMCKNVCTISTQPLVAPEGASCDLSGRKALCGPGLVCKPSPNRSKGKTFGICTGKKVQIPESLPSPPPLPCPIRNCTVQCKYGYAVSDIGCKTCQCRKKKSPCSLPKQPGPCLASHVRYYFNHKVGKCMKFIYGGCQHNANNFKTRKACERKCLM